MAIECLAFRARKSNTLHGFADFQLTNIKLQIRECTIHEKNGRRWVGLPARPQLDRDGHALKEDSGKVKYVAVLQFSDRDAGDQFSAKAIEALLERFPNAFDAGEAAA